MKPNLHHISLHRNRGAISISTVVLIIIAIIVVGAIFLSVSKPWGQIAKDTWRGATEWTPENITKNPIAYFNWAIGELEKLQQQLKANRFAVAVEREKASRAAAQHAATAAALKAAIDSAKAAYKALPDAPPAADGGVVKKFPLTWQGNEFKTLTEFRRQVLESDNERKNAEMQAKHLTGLAQKLEIYLVQIADKVSETAMELNTANAKLAILKVEKTIEGLGEIGSSINDIIVKTGVLVNETDKNAIARVAAQNAVMQKSGQSDADFEALMR